MVNPQGDAGVRAPAGFRNVALVGTGATSRVYRAVASDTGQPRALKRLNRHLVRSQDALARLRRELELLRKLRHPGIVSVYDVFRWDGDPTLVMDFVEGADLEAVVAEAGRLAPAEVERIARSLFDILGATHAAGIVHRDIKPQNVRLGSDGRVFLLDFGSARLDAASQLTATGTTVGTPDYMAPELFAGSAYDPRVDIYGVGATLYEALTGAPPQSADSLAALTWLRQTEDVRPVYLKAPDTPAPLAQVVDRCLAREPGARYASASHAVWALDNPAVERAFALHRSRYPPCVECDAPLPPTLRNCPSCGRAGAFSFAPGVHHVEVAGLSDPAPFLRWVTGRFPELLSDRARMMEWCAALSTGGRRYLAFVSKEDADAEVARLADVGVSARSFPQPVVSLVVTVVAVALVLHGLSWLPNTLLASVLCLAVGANYFLTALSRYIGSRGSLLGMGWMGAWIGGGEWIAMAAVSVAWMLPKRWMPQGDAWSWLTFPWRVPIEIPLDPGLAIAGIALPVMFAAIPATFLVARLRGSRLYSASSPQPSVRVASLFGQMPERKRRSGSLVRTGGMALLIVFVLTLEAMGGGALVGPFYNARPEINPVSEWVERLGRDPLTEDSDFAPVASVASGAGSASESEISGPVDLRSGLAVEPQTEVENEAKSASVEQPAGAQSWLLHRTSFWWLLNLVPLLVCLGLGVRAYLRRRRVAVEARALSSEVGELWGPDPPTGREEGSEDWGPPDADGFVRAALVRTRRLSAYLPPRLMDEVTADLDGSARGSSHDDSLLAQCVLETDDEQLARFRFLSLEGELEAEAAQAWWEAQA